MLCDYLTGGPEVTTQTKFQAASMSKPVMALGALSMVEKGEMDLDENINDKLTSWQVSMAISNTIIMLMCK